MAANGHRIRNNAVPSTLTQLFQSIVKRVYNTNFIYIFTPRKVKISRIAPIDRYCKELFKFIIKILL